MPINGHWLAEREKKEKDEGKKYREQEKASERASGGAGTVHRDVTKVAI